MDTVSSGMQKIHIPFNPTILARHPQGPIGFMRQLSSSIKEVYDQHGHDAEVIISAGKHRVETLSLMSLVTVFMQTTREIVLWVRKEVAHLIEPLLKTLFQVQ